MTASVQAHPLVLVLATGGARDDEDGGGALAPAAGAATATTTTRTTTATAAVAAAAGDDARGALEPRALRGDRDAWNALVERHNHRVVVALLARGVRIDRARDLAQDAWLRLIEQQRRGALRELSLPGLAVTQALFLARDAARRDGCARGVLADDADDARRAADPARSVEDRLLTSEQLARARDALRALHPTARRVFEMVYENPDAEYADVAREVGLSLQRVRQIVCEVRKKLRAAVEG